MKKLLYLIPVLSSVLFSAQNSDSLWHVIKFRQNTIALDNPLFAINMDSVNIGNSTLEYFNKNNNFRDAYMAKKSEGFAIQSERFVTLKNWKFYGKFSFSKYDDYETRHKAQADAYRDNPYKIVDSANADWRMQHYYLQTKIISPYINRYTRAGLGIKYEVLNGARQKDPRPLDKTINIELTPALMFDLNSKFKIGINGYYNLYKQDLTISLENHLKPQNIYKLLGLGEYLYNGPIIMTGGISRMYRGNTFGGGLSLGYDIKPNHQLRSIFSFKNNIEKTTDGTSIPFNAGEHQYTDLEGTILYNIRGRKADHNFDLYGLFRATSDTEFVQFLNTATQQYEVLTSAEMHWKDALLLRLNYEGLLRNHIGQLQYSLFSGLGINYFNEQYPTTNSKESITNLNAHIGLKRWFYLGKNSISASYKAIYKTNLSKEYVYYQKDISTNFAANEIVYPNHLFNTLNTFGNRLDIQFIFDTFKKTKSQLYLKASYENLQSFSANSLYEKGLNNNYFMFTIGLYN